MPATLADIQRKYGESVYPLYKDQMHEPYMEGDNGIGYKGVVMYDEVDDKVQCAECGKWFKFITEGHLRTHQTNQLDYRKTYGINKSTPLCTPSFSSTMRDLTFERIKQVGKKWGFPKGNKHGNKISKTENMESHTTSQYKNKYGLCDAQIAARMVIVAKSVGKDITNITTKDINKYDRRLYAVMYSRFGSINNAAKHLGINSTRIRGNFEDAEIISLLRNFVVNTKRLPKETDCTNSNKLPNKKTIITHFGSWSRAKMMAGLDQLLEEVKNK